MTQSGEPPVLPDPADREAYEAAKKAWVKAMQDAGATVWSSRPIEEEPSIRLMHWRFYRVTWQTHEPSLHLNGYIPARGEGYTSSPIVEFDASSRRAVSRSGRVFQLDGPPGLHPDADYVFRAWLAGNGIGADDVELRVTVLRLTDDGQLVPVSSPLEDVFPCEDDEDDDITEQLEILMTTQRERLHVLTARPPESLQERVRLWNEAEEAERSMAVLCRMDACETAARVHDANADNCVAMADRLLSDLDGSRDA